VGKKHEGAQQPCQFSTIHFVQPLMPDNPHARLPLSFITSLKKKYYFAIHPSDSGQQRCFKRKGVTRYRFVMFLEQ
jgi:hypothetical protein